MILAGILLYGVLPSVYYRVIKPLPRLRSTSSKTICLTFDDGPDPRFTNQLLDLLAKYNIKATFFVVAAFAQDNPEIINRFIDEGHSIGLHSLSHRNSMWVSPFYTKHDFKESIKILNNLGILVPFYRPPWGLFNIFTAKYIRKYNLNLVLWDVMAEDWRGNTTSDIISAKLLKRTRDCSIICLHDGRGTNNAPKRTIEALEKTIPVLIDKGYTFVKADELYKQFTY